MDRLCFKFVKEYDIPKRLVAESCWSVTAVLAQNASCTCRCESNPVPDASRKLEFSFSLKNKIHLDLLLILVEKNKPLYNRH